MEVIQQDTWHRIFFKTTGDIPFDLFGAAFWLLSRYEEYLPHQSDAYKRFHYRSSLAWQYQFLHLPLVNIWLAELQRQLAKRYPQLTFKKRQYNLLSSIDIDNAYKYKHKGFVRTLAGFVSDRKLSNLLQRLRITLNREQDPFDCYDFLIQTHRELNVEAIYFLLLGDYGPNDKNHAATNLNFQVLMKHLADYSLVGIHPSFGSNNSQHQLKVETNRLSNIIHRTVTRSRQHFSVLRFPDTYQHLLQAGIETDYSMGYPNCNGFRASYCYPYRWYNLEIESATPLIIHPFCLTEATLMSEREKTGKSLTELSQPLVEEVKKYGGELVPIFHNDLFDENMKAFYREFLKNSL